jgi:tellurite resistance protein TerC
LNQLLFWIVFNLFVLLVLVLDLGVFHRGSGKVSLRDALGWSLAWVALAGGFALLLYFWHGQKAVLEFATGYVIELSLSVDNLFVFLLIFRYFKVPAGYQHKVLVWGILGAVIMRVVFILAGVRLLQRFSWVIYAFGALLVYSGIRLLAKHDGSTIKPDKNPLLRLLRKWVPVTEDYEGDKFFTRRDGLYATPLFAVLLVIETTDVLFATDSIPAILAITRDVVIVYASNVFAILGLRSMYFALAGMMEMFEYLHYGLAAVLIFIGAKMLVSHYYEMPTILALSVVAGILGASVAASVSRRRRQERRR